MTMTEIIRSLIRESVCELRMEDAYADELIKGLSSDSIIGNSKIAAEFARETIQRDIPELRNYSMNEYFPINEFKEKWTFEGETSTLLNVVTVKHIIKDGVSHWQFLFSTAEPSMERMTAEIRYKTELLPSYDQMVKKANDDWQLWG